MAVRNFWIEAEVDGRQTTLAGGPRSKDGGMYVKLYQRDEGGIKEIIKIYCWADCGGMLKTDIEIKADNPIETSIVTTR